jgi:hypothetical protein
LRQRVLRLVWSRWELVKPDSDTVCRLAISARALANAQPLSSGPQVDTTATHRLYLMHVNMKRTTKPCIVALLSVRLLVHAMVDWGSYD